MKLFNVALSLLWATKASAQDTQKEDLREVAAALHLDSQLVRESYLRGIDQDMMITKTKKKNGRNNRNGNDFRKEWVDTHNQYREEYVDKLDGREIHTKRGEVKTYKYAAIKWDTSLRDMAQDWADEIVKDCSNNRAPKDNYGVNSAERTKSNDLQAIQDIMAQWNRNLDTFPDLKSRAMSQAVWMGSKYVGCADAVSDPDAKKKCTFSVCYYAKAGNCGPGKYDSWEDFLVSSEAACGPCPSDKENC